MKKCKLNQGTTLTLAIGRAPEAQRLWEEKGFITKTMLEGHSAEWNEI